MSFPDDSASRKNASLHSEIKDKPNKKKIHKTEYSHLGVAPSQTCERISCSLFIRSEQTKAQESKAGLTYKAHLTYII